VNRPNWFVALPMPAAAAPAWLAVAATAPVPLRRFLPADLHLTLAFLGPCDGSAALAAWRALADQVHRPIPIRAGGWRALGPVMAPSAYGLTLAEGQAELSRLLGDWGARALVAAGCRPERRAPLPHLTLLRPPRRQAAALRQPMAAWMAAAPLPAEPALLSQLALYTWADDRRQRLFRIIRSRCLASPPPPEPPTWAE
jgi:2'-5' RNA ligase